LKDNVDWLILHFKGKRRKKVPTPLPFRFAFPTFFPTFC
jgi:hypothetical protein